MTAMLTVAGGILIAATVIGLFSGGIAILHLGIEDSDGTARGWGIGLMAAAVTVAICIIFPDLPSILIGLALFQLK
jgi:hypothetical protein